MSVPVSDILSRSEKWLPAGLTKVAGGFIALGAVGLVLAFFAVQSPGTGWAALLTATVMIIGIAMVGPLLSAIFEISGAKWGRVFRRLAEGTVALMPVGLVALIIVMAGGNAYLPWVHVHPHHGGKAIWLTRGFWDARVIVSLLIAYGAGLAFVKHGVQRDLCIEAVRTRFTGKLAAMLTRGITDPEKTRAKNSEKMARLAPAVAVIYGVVFSLLGFDLIMALEPDWFSTLFGAWYFIGNAFAGLALIAVLSVAVSRRPGMAAYFTKVRLADMATLLLAFCLLNGDFFWNQYLTIWYANLPEETFYVIDRTVEAGSAWRSLSFVSLGTFFFIPFLALLIRKIKTSGPLLVGVSLIAVLGVFLSRFIEIAPAVAGIDKTNLGEAVLAAAASLMIFIGLIGAGLLVFGKVFESVPIMAVGDDVLVSTLSEKEGH